MNKHASVVGLAVAFAVVGFGAVESSAQRTFCEYVCNDADCAAERGENFACRGPTPETSYCEQRCDVAADCVSDPDFEEQRFECVNAWCWNVGCASDVACAEHWGEGWRCSASTGYCYPACEVAADCASLDDRAVTTWACEDGACIDEGCQDDAACQAEFGSTYGCVKQPGSFNFCDRTCETDTDCAALEYTAADSFVCINQRCVSIGCQSDAECEESYGAGAVCGDDDGGWYGRQCEVSCSIDDDCASVGGGCLDGRCSWAAWGACESAADCTDPGASPAWDEDNFRCVELVPVEEEDDDADSVIPSPAALLEDAAGCQGGRVPSGRADFAALALAIGAGLLSRRRRGGTGVRRR